MNQPQAAPALPENSSGGETKLREASPLSLNRLREAFAQMLGSGETAAPAAHVDLAGVTETASDNRASPVEPACEVNPRSVVEAMLFVGRPDNAAFSARELAAAMRGVSPAEIDSVVVELNALYDDDAAPYRIESSSGGYRLALRESFERMRDKFYGRVREARLSPAVVEVLSVVSYNQPATADEINQLRGAPSGAALSTLVRRKLIRLERPEGGGPPQYWTTDRFLRLFGLENLAALPRSEELEKG
jgi:segregation and condensation protein B